MTILDVFKKKEIPMPVPVSDTPLPQVMSLQAQGLTTAQIVQALQTQGYPPNQIYDAISQAEIRKSSEPVESKHPESETIVEQIIEEKWHELQKELGKISEWKEAISSRMDKLEQGMADVRADLDGLHKAIVARIGDYDKTLMDVGTEIKAMEKVFQKVLPELTGNVQELSRITKNVKVEKKK